MNDFAVNPYCCMLCVNQGFVHWLFRDALPKEHNLLESNAPDAVLGC